jgi:hypothetical protein
MVPLYDKPVRLLMRGMASEMGLRKRDILERDEVLEWFRKKYPKVKEGTVTAHLLQLSTNVPSRIHYNLRPTGEDDFFFRIDPSHFRLYDPENDPAPIHKDRPASLEPHESDAAPGSSEFAYERDLRNFLSKNLGLIEPRLSLYKEEEITGIEFPVGGRYIDILAVDSDKDYVVVELKVSRGYDRAVGQLLRYMAWIEQNQADPGQKVRGIIVAKEISEDLRLACSKVSGVDLYTYELSVSLSKESP